MERLTKILIWIGHSYKIYGRKRKRIKIRKREREQTGRRINRSILAIFNRTSCPIKPAVRFFYDYVCQFGAIPRLTVDLTTWRMNRFRVDSLDSLQKESMMNVTFEVPLILFRTDGRRPETAFRVSIMEFSNGTFAESASTISASRCDRK